MNQDKWESLEPQTQEAIEETMREMEPEIFELYRELVADETKIWRDAGVEMLEFTGEDAERILRIAYVDAWDELDWDNIVQRTPQAEEIKQKFTDHYAPDFSNAVPGGTVIEPSS